MKFYKPTQENFESVYSDYVEWCYQHKCSRIITSALCIVPYKKPSGYSKNTCRIPNGNKKFLVTILGIKYNEGKKSEDKNPFIEFYFNNV